MSKITATQISELLKANKQPETFEHIYNDVKINIRTDLTVEEKNNFIEQVITDVYTDPINPSELYKDVSFVITFLAMCTDIPLPKTTLEDGNKVIDTQKSYDMAKMLNLSIMNYDSALFQKCSYISDLYGYIEERIRFENAKLIAYAGVSTATDGAIETFSAVMHSLLDTVENNKNKISGLLDKFSKVLTKGKIEKFIGDFQELIPKKELKVIKKETGEGVKDGNG